MNSQEQEGIGVHKMWGYTAAQDLLLDAPQRGEVNILVCQAGDVGHVLRTIASRRRHPQRHTINLYVWEGQIEVLARHLLLLGVAKDWELPIRQRANTFLEIFGNAFLQERTSRYIARLGKELVEMLFSTKKDPTADVVDFSLLKWRHRDLLEMTLKSWDSSAPCDLKKLRDSRLRDFYGVRYDYRKNVVDWDYTNRLKEVASIIHLTQYRKWRLDGIAYEFGDQVYNEPNRTMMSYAEGIMLKGEQRGTKKEMRGLWLDIRVGPFITFGVDCDRPNAHAEDLFTIINKGTGTEQHRHNTAEVAVYSIISYLWGLEYRGQYVMTKKDDVYSGLGDTEELETCYSKVAKGGEESVQSREESEGIAEISEVIDVDAQESRSGDALDGKDKADVDVKNISRKVIDEADTKSTENLRKDQALARAQCILETFDGVKVFMLSGDISRDFSKPRFRQLFHRVHLSLTAVDLVGVASINECLADDAVITMDTGRYMVPLNQAQQLTFIERVCSMASDRGWKGLLNEPGLKGGPDGHTDKKGEDVLLSMDHIGFSFKRKDV